MPQAHENVLISLKFRKKNSFRLKDILIDNTIFTLYKCNDNVLIFNGRRGPRGRVSSERPERHDAAVKPGPRAAARTMERKGEPGFADPAPLIFSLFECYLRIRFPFTKSVNITRGSFPLRSCLLN